IVAGVGTAAHGTLFSVKVALTPIPFTLIGLALAIFLGFRNSVAYDRYWEARKLWGEVAFTSRSLARQCQSLIVDSKPIDPRNLSEDVRVRMIFRAIAFAHVLRLRLRHLDELNAEVKSMLRMEEWQQLIHARNGPIFLLQMM